MANRIDLVRHPDKEGEREGVYLGNKAKITERGEHEAEIVIERLAKTPHDRIVSSQIPRAVELAKRYGERLNLPVTTDALFNEIDKPQFLVGLRRNDQIHAKVMQIIRDHFDAGTVPELPRKLRREIRARLGIRLPAEIQVKGREQIEDEVCRAFETFERYDGTSILVVSHAKRIAAYVHWLLNGGTLKGFYQGTDRTLRLATTGITTLVRMPDRRTHEMHWHVENVNDTAHFQEWENKRIDDLLDRIT